MLTLEQSKEYTQKAIEAMAKDSEYKYLANYVLQRTKNCDTNSNSQVAVGVFWLQTDYLATGLNFINRTGDTNIFHGIVNIKHIFWLMVFFDSLMQRYATNKTIMINNTSFDLIDHGLCGPCSTGHSQNWADYILCFFMQGDEDHFASASICFPDGQTAPVPSSDLELTIRCGGVGVHDTAYTRKLKDLHFDNLFE